MLFQYVFHPQHPRASAWGSGAVGAVRTGFAASWTAVWPAKGAPGQRHPKGWMVWFNLNFSALCVWVEK